MVDSTDCMFSSAMVLSLVSCILTTAWPEIPPYLFAIMCLTGSADVQPGYNREAAKKVDDMFVTE